MACIHALAYLIAPISPIETILSNTHIPIQVTSCPKKETTQRVYYNVHLWMVVLYDGNKEPPITRDYEAIVQY